jgi:signal transduction histidine kinase
MHGHGHAFCGCGAGHPRSLDRLRRPLPKKVSDAKVIATFELFCQLISLQLDIEERLENSAAALLDEQQTAELREQFIAVLGHDMRTPLSSIVAAAPALQRMPQSTQATAFVERIKRSGDRMARLIDNILDFARGRMGGGIPVIRHPDPQLSHVLVHVIAELTAIHPQRKVDATIDITKPVSCDPGRIAQLLANLLSNALVHGNENDPVSVVARRDGDLFVLSVTNTGEPIPKEILPRLFHPFSRGAGAKHQEGLGLGLYIAHQIAAAHNGTLSVDSTPASTTFTLSMPAGK